MKNVINGNKILIKVLNNFGYFKDIKLYIII